jgi:hypothetical protein
MISIFTKLLRLTPLIFAFALLLSFTLTDLFTQTTVATPPSLSNEEKVRQDLQRLSSLEQLKIINAWLYLSLKVYDPKDSPNLIEGMMEQLTGSCGPRDLFISHFFKDTPVKHRQINFYGLPGGMVAHSATEVFIDDEWRFVDGTFGLYFASPDNPELPLSIESARENYPDIIVMRVMGDGWKGVWEDIDNLTERLKNKKLYQKVEDRDILYPSRPDILAGNVEQTYITSTSTKASPQEVLSVPISISLNSTPSGQLGKLNQELSDLTPFAQDIGNNTIYTPYCYTIGLFGTKGPVIDKVFNFSTRKTSDLTLTLHFLKDVPVNHRRYFLTQVRSADVQKVPFFSSEEHQWTENTLTLKTRVSPPSTNIKLYLGREFAREHSYSIDAITWTSSPSPQD